MSRQPTASTCALPPSLLWPRLVDRSIDAWDHVADVEARKSRQPREFLQGWNSLDDFLNKSPKQLMFWFFQRREAFLLQTRLSKWSPQHLEDYILFPAQPGFVFRVDCFFISHFWRSSDHPDPDGKYLRLHQEELRQQEWSFIWLDWTCMPQSPRNELEEAYFLRSLETMSGIIRNCGFMYFFPPWKPRLWILYEITSYVLTVADDIEQHWTPDIRIFTDHVNEMLRDGVRIVLRRHGYQCSFERDEIFLTAWLELLVLLKRLVEDVDELKRLMDHLTWSSTVKEYWAGVAGRSMHIEKFEGRLEYRGQRYSFLPFPHWEDGKFAIKRR